MIDGYLARLGLSARPAPTVATLADLHRRHLDVLPYDNLAIVLAAVTGAPQPSATAQEALARVAGGGNAGYCFHHNGLVELVLAELGYDVVPRRGELLEAAGPSGTLEHLVLEVRGLPSADNPGGRWWPDVGYGDGFRDPLPLVEGHFRQGPFRYRLARVGDDRWTFHHTAGASNLGTYVRGGVTRPEIDAAHQRLSTPPDGAFTRKLVVQRRDATGADTVRTIGWKRMGEGAGERALRDFEEWRAALTGLGLTLHGVADSDLRELHKHQTLAYDEWQALR